MNGATLMKRLLIAVLTLSSAFCIAQLVPEHAATYKVYGIVEQDVYPLTNAEGEFIQWNASTFEGFVLQGKTKKDVCADAKYCYAYDGQGNWYVNMTGTAFCVNTCSYTGTGALVISQPQYLLDGSYIQALSANMVGTFVDENGESWPGIMAVFNTTTAPSVNFEKDSIPVPAYGGITIVLQDN